MVRVRTLALGVCMTASVVFAACSHGNEANETNVAPPPPLVAVATVRQQSVPIVQDYSGTTGAIQSIDVKARVNGILESAPFKEGALVHRGQVIFTLQKEQYQAALQSAQAQLLAGNAALAQAEHTVPVQQAQANLEQKQAIYQRADTTVARITPLVANKALPQKDLDNALQSQAAAKADVAVAQAQLTNAGVNQTASIGTAQAQVLSAEAAVTNAKLNLSYTTIAAPITGLIGFLKFDVGNIVGSTGNDVLDTITSVDPIKVTFAVDENVFLALTNKKRRPEARSLAQQPLHLILADNSTYPYPGELYTINPTLDAKTGTISVEARFPNPDGEIRPGQFARIRLQVETRPNAILAPQEAVVQTQGVNTVYVVDAQNSIDLRSVTLGPAIGSNYVILSGLKPGERVVVQGTQKVRPGIKVVVKT